MLIEAHDTVYIRWPLPKGRPDRTESMPEVARKESAIQTKENPYVACGLVKEGIPTPQARIFLF
jgi:hypothetical protein